MIIYKFNKEGIEVGRYNNVIEAAQDLGVNRTYIYKAIDLGIKVKEMYILSYQQKGRLAKKLDIPADVNIGDIIRMQDYKQNLIITFSHYVSTPNHLQANVKRMLNEIKQLNDLLGK